MSEADDTILQRAIDWHLASQRDDMDWDGFTLWLECDPRHRVAYDEVALGDALLDDHRSLLLALSDSMEQPRRPTWAPWLGGAVAASLAILLALPYVAKPESRTFATAAAARTLALGDGSEVNLGPHSRLTMSGRHSDRIALSGGAFFAIRHDPSRPLTITAAGLEIADIGTQFDVQTHDQTVRVEVAQGQVELRGRALGSPIGLPAGKSYLFDPAHGRATIASVPLQDVGEWRKGRLTYDATPLPLVAADLERYAGVLVTVPTSLAGRRFSGTLSIQHGDSAIRDLAQLMDLQLSRSGDSYRLADHG